MKRYILTKKQMESLGLKTVDIERYSDGKGKYLFPDLLFQLFKESTNFKKIDWDKLKTV